MAESASQVHRQHRIDSVCFKVVAHCYRNNSCSSPARKRPRLWRPAIEQNNYQAGATEEEGKLKNGRQGEKCKCDYAASSSRAGLVAAAAAAAQAQDDNALEADCCCGRDRHQDRDKAAAIATLALAGPATGANNGRFKARPLARRAAAVLAAARGKPLIPAVTIVHLLIVSSLIFVKLFQLPLMIETQREQFWSNNDRWVPGAGALAFVEAPLQEKLWPATGNFQRSENNLNFNSGQTPLNLSKILSPGSARPVHENGGLARAETEVERDALPSLPAPLELTFWRATLDYYFPSFVGELFNWRRNSTASTTTTTARRPFLFAAAIELDQDNASDNNMGTSSAIIHVGELNEVAALDEDLSLGLVADNGGPEKGISAKRKRRRRKGEQQLLELQRKLKKHLHYLNLLILFSTATTTATTTTSSLSSLAPSPGISAGVGGLVADNEILKAIRRRQVKVAKIENDLRPASLFAGSLSKSTSDLYGITGEGLLFDNKPSSKLKRRAAAQQDQPSSGEEAILQANQSLGQHENSAPTKSNNNSDEEVFSASNDIMPLDDLMERTIGEELATIDVGAPASNSTDSGLQQTQQQQAKHAGTIETYTLDDQMDYICDGSSQFRSGPSPVVKSLFLLSYAFTFAFGLIGNTMTLYAMIRKRERFSVVDIFIANLALSDIMFCLFAVPITPVYLLLQSHWVLGLGLCKMFAFAQCASVYISTFTMINIAYVRYRLIVYPHSPSMTKWTASNLNFFTWVLACIITLPYLWHVDLKPDICPGKVFCDEDWTGDDRFWFSWATLGVQFLLPCASTSFFYNSVFWKLRKQRKLRKHQQHLQAAAAENNAAGKAIGSLICANHHQKLRGHRHRLHHHQQHKCNCRSSRRGHRRVEEDFRSVCVATDFPLTSLSPSNSNCLQVEDISKAGPGVYQNQVRMLVRLSQRRNSHDDQLMMLGGARGDQARRSSDGPIEPERGNSDSKANMVNSAPISETMAEETRVSYGSNQSIEVKVQSERADLEQVQPRQPERLERKEEPEVASAHLDDERAMSGGGGGGDGGGEPVLTVNGSMHSIAVSTVGVMASITMPEISGNLSGAAAADGDSGCSSSINPSPSSGSQDEGSRPAVEVTSGTENTLENVELNRSFPLALVANGIGNLVNGSQHKLNSRQLLRGSQHRKSASNNPLSETTLINSDEQACPHHQEVAFNVNILALREQRLREKDKRLSQTNRKLLFMVALFTLSWLPLNMFNLCQEYWDNMVNWAYFKHVFFTVHIIASFSVCYNPILYAWMSDNYRQELREILPKRIVEKFSYFFS